MLTIGFKIEEILTNVETTVRENTGNIIKLDNNILVKWLKNLEVLRKQRKKDAC